FRLQRGRYPLGVASNRQRPGDRLLESLRHHHRENLLAAAWQEMRRLATVDGSGIERVVRPDRDIELLFPIPVHVPEIHADGTVWIRLPSLKHRCNILSGVAAWIHYLDAGCPDWRLRLRLSVSDERRRRHFYC